MRSRVGASRLVGIRRRAPRARQPGRRRLRPHRHLLLFRQRHGQARPFAEPHLPRSPAPCRRLRARARPAPAAREDVGGRAMTPRARGLIVALLQIALVFTLGAKLLTDRATRPRVWVEVAPYDPDLPIRGRYVRLQLKAEARGFEDPSSQSGRGWGFARLTVEGDRLIAARTEAG